MAIFEIFNRRENRLAHRLVFLMVLSSSLLSVAATCIQLYSSYVRDKELLVVETRDVIEKSFRGSLENALWEFNFQQVEAVLDGIFAKVGVENIELVAATGHQWRRGKDTVRDDPITHSFALSRRTDGKTSEPIGTLKVGLTLDDVRARIWAQFWTLFFSNLGKTTLASLVMLLLFSAMVTRHLRKTAQFVIDAKWLEREEPLRLDRRETSDDLENIVRAINGAKTRVLGDLEKLQKSNAELTRSNRQLDDFAYIAAHDLKEPLRAIYNHAGFLLEDYEDRLEDDGKKRLHRLIALSQRAEKLIADLLYFSRLGRGDQAIEPIDLLSLLRDIEADQKDSFLERNVKFSIESELLPVLGHRPHIEAVFRNLIVNGVKYNDAVEKTIDIGSKAAAGNGLPDNVATFYVRDNGIGIEDKFKDDVFRIFKRLKSEKAYGEGTGAGLTFTKQIVENHGGRIWFTSVLGQGTAFFFTLPLADSASLSAKSRKAA